MPENKFNFTDDRLRNISPAPTKKRSYFYDSKTPGLRLQVTATGTKSFQFQVWFKNEKIPVTRTLGQYPALSINEARRKADAERTDVNKGINIESEARRLREEDTFEIAFQMWLEDHGKNKRSWQEDVRRYKLYIEIPFGCKKLSWFTDDRIRRWYKGITSQAKQRGTGNISPATANRALALVSTVFNKTMPKSPNPCKGVTKGREQSRDRFLQPEELKRFFEVLSSEGTPELVRDYILLSLFTGARRANILSMQWGEISFERAVWTISSSKSKNGTAMTIPLIDNAIEILARRKKQTSSVFVFPGTGTTGHYAEPKRAWNTLTRKAGLEDIRLHDLRRTMGSWQTMTGASSTIVGKTLGHKSPEATAVYARLNLDPVRASMETAVDAMLAARQLPEKIVKMGRTNEG